MRKAFLASLAAAVLSLGWMRTSSASHQDCCNRSPAKSVATAATSVLAMASLNADDVRKEFNSTAEKVRVVAPSFSYFSWVPVWTCGRRSVIDETRTALAQALNGDHALQAGSK